MAHAISTIGQKQQSRFVSFANSNGIHIPERLGNILPGGGVDDNTEQTTGISSNDLISQDNLDWDLWGPLIFHLFLLLFWHLPMNPNQPKCLVGRLHLFGYFISL